MFRFTIRDVLWLTVVVALSVGWWLDRREVVRRGEARVSAIQEAAERAARAHRKEIGDWKFRAESLQKHFNQEGKAIFRQGEEGREEVIVETATGASAYYDPRKFLESMKAKVKPPPQPPTTQAISN